MAGFFLFGGRQGSNPSPVALSFSVVDEMLEPILEFHYLSKPEHNKTFQNVNGILKIFIILD